MGMLGKNARSTGAAQGAGGLDLGSILASLGGGAMGGSGSGGLGDILGGLLGGTKGS